jgi:hypothetical protein
MVANNFGNKSFMQSYSHRVLQVPKLSPKNIPNNTSVLSHIICPKFKSHVYEQKRCTTVRCSCFDLRLEVQRGTSGGESPMCFKSIDDIGQSIWLLPKMKMNKYVSAHMN